MEEVVWHLIQSVGLQDDDSILLLQPTSPLRRVESLTGFVAKCTDPKQPVASAMSVSQSLDDFWFQDETGSLLRIRDQLPPTFQSRRTQERRPLLRENGLYYFANTGWFRHSGLLVSSASLPIVTPASESLDVNSWDDWHLAEMLLRHPPITSGPRG
jgi:N-acylneuraminate cytidylyltransferase